MFNNAEFDLALLTHKAQFRSSEARNALDLHGGVAETFQPRRNVVALVKRKLLNSLKPQPQDAGEARPIHAL